MNTQKLKASLAAALLVFLQASAARADDIACVSTTFLFIGANDKVCAPAWRPS
jgi:catabolite regulation protein CreA